MFPHGRFLCCPRAQRTDCSECSVSVPQAAVAHGLPIAGRKWRMTLRSDRVASLEEAKAQLKSWDALEGVGKTGGVAVGTDHQRSHALRTTACRLPLAS